MSKEARAVVTSLQDNEPPDVELLRLLAHYVTKEMHFRGGYAFNTNLARIEGLILEIG